MSYTHTNGYMYTGILLFKFVNKICVLRPTLEGSRGRPAKIVGYREKVDTDGWDLVRFLVSTLQLGPFRSSFPDMKGRNVRVRFLTTGTHTCV